MLLSGAVFASQATWRKFEASRRAMSGKDVAKLNKVIRKVLLDFRVAKILGALQTMCFLLEVASCSILLLRYFFCLLEVTSSRFSNFCANVIC